MPSRVGLPGEPSLESMLVMEDNVISIEVFPHVAKNYGPSTCILYCLLYIVVTRGMAQA